MSYFHSRISHFPSVISHCATCPQVEQNAERVLREIEREELGFSATIAAGQSQLDKVLARTAESGSTVVPGAAAFSLYDTCGFPLELTQEVAAERGLTVDEAGFAVAMAEQRTRSKVRT